MINQNRPGDRQESFFRSANYRLQIELVKKYYPQNHCFYNGFGELVVQGQVQDVDYLYTYKYTIWFRADDCFYAKIDSPVIQPNADLHIGKSGILCLFHKDLYPAYKRFCLATEIIPMVIKWTLFKEFFDFNGHKFLGNEIPHRIRFSFAA